MRIAAAFLSWMMLTSAAWACSSRAVENTTTPMPPVRAFAVRSHHDQTKQFAGRQPKSILIGDSIAQRWTRSLLAPTFGEDVVNLGVHSDRIRNVLWRLDETTVDFSQAEEIFIAVGMNDLRAGMPACAIEEGFEALATKLRAKAPHASLTFFEVLPMGVRLEAFKTVRKDVNAWLQARSPSWTTIPVPRAFACDRLFPSDCGMLLLDNVHPTDAGYRALSEAVTEREQAPYLLTKR